MPQAAPQPSGKAHAVEDSNSSARNGSRVTMELAPEETSEENKLGLQTIKNIVRDQRQIWTSPARVRLGHADWLVQLGGTRRSGNSSDEPLLAERAQCASVWLSPREGGRLVCAWWRHYQRCIGAARLLGFARLEHVRVCPVRAMEVSFAAEKCNDLHAVHLLAAFPAALIWKDSAEGKASVSQTLFGFGDLELHEWLWLTPLIAPESCLSVPARH